MGKRILLVEGDDDRHVMWNLCEVRAVPEKFTVELPEEDSQENGGLEKLLDSIPWRLATSDLECLAVVVDANDKGPRARWQAIRSRLASRGHEDCPADLPQEGAVFDISLRPQTPRSIRFGVWIMPDNQSKGMIEDFVAGLIREDDAMLPLVDCFIDSIPEGQRRFTKPHQPKARMHSWLAVSERPGRPMGQAIKADGHLDANSPSVKPFLDWLHAALVK